MNIRISSLLYRKFLMKRAKRNIFDHFSDEISEKKKIFSFVVNGKGKDDFYFVFFLIK